MGIFNRCLLFLYTLFFGILSLGVVLLCFQIVPERVLVNEYRFLASQWQTGLLFGIFFLFSIHLLFCAFASNNKDKVLNAKELVIAQGNTGEVHIAMSALKNMAERLAGNINGVREAKVKASLVQNQEKGTAVMMDVKIKIGQERNAAAIADDIRNVVKANLEKISGLESPEVAVSVLEIVSGVAVKKRKVN